MGAGLVCDPAYIVSGITLVRFRFGEIPLVVLGQMR